MNQSASRASAELNFLATRDFDATARGLTAPGNGLVRDDSVRGAARPSGPRLDGDESALIALLGVLQPGDRGFEIVQP